VLGEFGSRMQYLGSLNSCHKIVVTEGRQRTMSQLDLYNCAAPQEPLQALCASTKRLYGPH
jgi:hypothetical protein